MYTNKYFYKSFHSIQFNILKIAVGDSQIKRDSAFHFDLH
jgi:hypothetical protein